MAKDTEASLPAANKSKSIAASMMEIGRTGLNAHSGIVSEEYLVQLRGAKGRRILQEMAENEPIIGGFILAFIEVIRRMDWHIEDPEDADGEESDAAIFLRECLDDMSEDWPTTLGSILTCLTYGWSFHEIIYKRRNGPHEKPSQNSKFTDGRIGWRKFAPRSQHSLMQWVMDEEGGVQGMKQTTVQGTFTIPIEKALLFRIRPENNNPEGRPIIRSCYRPWYFKKYIEEMEAIGVERDLAGLPKITMDVKYFYESASDDEKATKAAMEAMARNIKRNEVEGIVFPVEYDKEGNKLIDIELMSTGGTRQQSTDDIISRNSQAMAMAVLADFLLLGHEKVGSKSLGVAKIDLWMLAVESVAKAIAAVINTHAIPRLLRLNGIDAENPPQLVYGAIDNTDLSVLGQFLKDATEAGVLVPDRAIEDHIRTLADFPPVDDDDRDLTYPEGYKYGPQPVPDALANPDDGQEPDQPEDKAPGADKSELPTAPKGDKAPPAPKGKRADRKA